MDRAQASRTYILYAWTTTDCFVWVRGEPVRARIRTKHTILAVPIHADPLGPSDRHPDGRTRMLLARATILVRTRGSNAFSRNRYRSAEVPGARRKRLAQNHHSGGQPVRAAGRWRDHGGQPDHRDGLCRPCRPPTTRPLAKRHALPTINRGSCSARRICHQQAFAGSQHLVGWR